MIKILSALLITLTLLTGFNTSCSAQEQQMGDTIVKSKFDTRELIFDHIKDSYEWHITTIGNVVVSIPLPVLLYSEQSGFHFFLSSAFHNESHRYLGFKFAEEGKYEHKIVEVLTDGTEVRPWDFSITKNVTSLFISFIIIITLFINLAKRYRENAEKAPKGIQNWIEPMVVFVRDDIAKPSFGEGQYQKFLPYLLTIFFFIFINNLMGILPTFPGGANLTGNITITMVLAIFTFVLTSLNGSRDYWVHMVNAPGIPWWLKFPIPLMPIVEIMSVFIKPFVLTIRLFANITAGHIIALGFYSLIFIFAEKSPVAAYGVSVISIAFTIFMSILELLVAFIQAYVFTLLSAIYIGMASESHQAHPGKG